MIHLEGYSISFEFDNLIQMSDLIYYDGPLLSHFVSKAGDDYLFYWVDVDEEFNRWMFFRTNTTIIQSYLDKKISLRDIILGLNERFVYIVEVDDDSNFLNTRIVSLSYQLNILTIVLRSMTMIVWTLYLDKIVQECLNYIWMEMILDMAQLH